MTTPVKNPLIKSRTEWADAIDEALAKMLGGSIMLDREAARQIRDYLRRDAEQMKEQP